MSHNILKIKEDKLVGHPVSLYRSTVSDMVTIMCGSQEIWLEQDEFKALAHILCHDFYTRGMIEEAQEHNQKDVRPYDIYSSYDEENWELVVERNKKL